LFHGSDKLAFILELASEEAAKHGLAAMDALHVAAAYVTDVHLCIID
jgi:predicted nucleic acid-binding protein